MPDLSSFTQGTSDVAASDFLIGYVSAAGPGSERRWTAQDLTTGLLSLVGATPSELAHLSGTTGNIQSQINTVQADVDTHEARVDNPHTVTATQVGLGNVDNTSDADKPVSTLQASAIGVVQADVDTHEARVDNPHTVTATQVGLGNVDNTSDVDKPVSTLQQAAIDAAGGGAFSADANTQITPSTPIVLGQDTGDEAALTLDYTTNKATSGDDTGLLINQTDTDSPGTSKLMDLQVGGASKFSVDSAGTVDIGSEFNKFDLVLGNTTNSLGIAVKNFGVNKAIISAYHTTGNSGYLLRWGNSTTASTSADLILGRDAAATLQLGINDATTPTGQTIKAHDVVNGTGADLTLSGGLGDVANGNVILEGNVGIGTTSPSHALDVVGSVNIDATGSYKKEGTAVLDYDSTLFNVSVGALALSDALLTGSANTASGYVALASNTTGANNTASGYAALNSNTTGANNTASGRNALLFNDTGANNTASGYAALQSNDTGVNNTASGRSALEFNTSGGFNTAAGYQSGRYQSGGTTSLTTASNSVFLGATTKGVQGATNQIVIGDTAESIGANSVVLGNDSIVTTALKGTIGIGTTTPDANAILDVSSTTKAFLPPRMTTAQKNAIASPAEGMLVYDSTLNKLAVYTGAAWEAITSA